MKRLILIFLTLAVLLCGCAEKSKLDLVPENGYDTSGLRMVIFSSKRLIPLSLTLDGKQQIESGIYWYYELENELLDGKGSHFQTYNIKTLELASERSWEKLKNKRCYAVNGDWPLFGISEHQAYSDKKQDKLPEHIKASFMAALESNGLDKTTGVITDLWYCDFDKDGSEELFLSGTAGEGDHSLVAYVKGDKCQLIRNDRSAAAELTPLIMDLEGTGIWSLVLLREGEYNEFSVYDYKDGNFMSKYQIIF